MRWWLTVGGEAVDYSQETNPAIGIILVIGGLIIFVAAFLGWRPDR
jgi:hypothetical protein